MVKKSYLYKLYSLLPQTGRKKILLLQVVFLIAALIQVAGVASIAPFVGVVSNPELIENNVFFLGLYDLLRSSTYIDFVVKFAVVVMVVILLGNSISGYSVWMLNKVSIEIGLIMQTRFLSLYLGNNYEYFASRNSAEILSVVTQEIPRFIYNVLQPMLNLTSQLFVFIVIVVVLTYVDYQLSLISIAVVTFIYLFIYMMLKSELIKHGRIISEKNAEKLKRLNECLEGVKLVKLKDLEQVYIDNIKMLNRETLNSSAFIGLAGDIPRFLVETVVFVCILILSIYLISKYGESGKVMSVLSLYAMAGYKLLPAAQTIFKSMSLIKANGGVVVELLEEVENVVPEGGGLQEQPDKRGNITSRVDSDDYKAWDQQDVELKLRGISFHYTEGKGKILDNFNLDIPARGITAIIGKSGSGKSTIIDLILGLLEPIEGGLYYGDMAISRSNLHAWKSRIGYVPQSVYLIDGSILENIVFGSDLDHVDYERVKQAASIAQLNEFVDSLPGGYFYKVGERGGSLSGGQVQRIGLARALYSNPDILVLDEATSALDNHTESEVMGAIKKMSENIMVIMVAHRLSSILWANNIVYLENGRVVCQGEFDQLIENVRDFKAFIDAGRRGG